jgi:hypothetical protein
MLGRAGDLRVLQRVAATTNGQAVVITRYSQPGRVIFQTATRAQCQPSRASQAASWRDTAVAGRGGGARKKVNRNPRRACEPHLGVARLAYEARRERGAGPHRSSRRITDPAGMRARRERGAGSSYMAPAGPLARWDEARRERAPGLRQLPPDHRSGGDEGPARAGRRVLIYGSCRASGSGGMRPGVSGAPGLRQLPPDHRSGGDESPARAGRRALIQLLAG